MTAKTQDTSTHVPVEPKDNRDTLFLKFQFHPDNISRQQVWAEYKEHLALLFGEELGIKRAILAYSRSKSIGDDMTQAKLHQTPNETGSKTMGEYKEGSNL